MKLSDDVEFGDDESGSSGFYRILTTYKVPILIGIGSIVCITASIVLLVKTTQTASPIRFSTDSDVLGTSHTIKIDIEGGVVQPGVYEVPADSRIEDCITKAGGLSDNVDAGILAKTLNRAKGVEDGMKIYIPVLNANITSHNNGFATSDESKMSQNHDGIVTTPQMSSQNAVGSVATLVSINSANQSELDSLPGVGPVTSKKIIDNRPYSDIQELVTKKVVGQSVFGKIQDLISL